MSSLNIKKWKLNKNIKFLFKTFKKNNEETRFIGGCIRDLIIEKNKNNKKWFKSRNSYCNLK